MIGTSEGQQFPDDASFQVSMLQQPQQPDTEENSLSDMKGDIEFRRFIDQARPPRQTPVWKPGTPVPDPNGMGRKIVVAGDNLMGEGYDWDTAYAYGQNGSQNKTRDQVVKEHPNEDYMGYYPSSEDASRGLMYFRNKPKSPGDKGETDKGRLMSDNSNVHVIRHGSTDYNSDEKVRGWANVPLNEEGKQESLEVADSLKDEDIQAIFHSDLDRAADTAKDIAAKTGAELIPAHQFRSWDVGELTGKHYSDATPIMKDYAQNKPDEPIPGGESFNQFRERVQDGLRKAEEYAQGRPSAIVTHRGVERLLNALDHPQSDRVDMKEFFADGEDTGSHQKMSLFGQTTNHDKAVDEIIGVTKGLKIDPKAWKEWLASQPKSDNIEDRRNDIPSTKDKLRFLFDQVMHRNITDDLLR